MGRFEVPLLANSISMKFSSADRYYLKTVFLLLLICFLVYFNSLKSPFQFDDVKFIEENPYIKSVPIFFEQFGNQAQKLFLN